MCGRERDRGERDTKREESILGQSLHNERSGCCSVTGFTSPCVCGVFENS
jgi:hypothetical protein